MKTLICVANFGEKQLSYLDIVLRQYDSFSPHLFSIDVILFSTSKHDELIKSYKNLNIKEIVYPESTGTLLPSKHKEFFKTERSNYDLFIYTENDIRVTESNVKTFLDMTEICKGTKYIPSFLRFEICKMNDFVSICDLHFKHARWGGGNKENVIKDVMTIKGHKFFYPFNVHCGMYILTKAQLASVIDNANFYSTTSYVRNLESSASGVYFNCGIHKIVSYNLLENSLIHHLPNKYCDSSFSLKTVRDIVDAKFEAKKIQI